MDKKNYPAAHSMDSHWFGVDLEGNVAVFDTGESGVVPKDAIANPDGFYFLLTSLTPDENGIRHFYISETILDQYLKMESLWEYYDRLRLRFSSNDKQIPTYLISGVALEFKSKSILLTVKNNFLIVRLHQEREIYYISRFDNIPIFEMIDNGEIIGAIMEFTNAGLIASITQSFFYNEKPQYAFDRGISDYQRVIAPPDPIKLNMFPPEIQDKFRLTLPILFSETPTFQPLEFMKGHAYEKYYIDKNGKRIDYEWDSSW